MKPKLTEVALIAEIISAFAIILTLFFVGFQVSDNARATRSATANSSVASLAAWYSSVGQSEQASARFYNAMTNPDLLTQEQWFQFIMQFHGAMLNFQNSYYLVDEGTLDIQI